MTPVTDADTVRDALSWIHSHPDLSMEFQREAEAAFNRLVAERDEALAQNAAATDQIASASDARARLDDRLVAVEAERDRLRAALERIANLQAPTMGTGSYSAEMREIAREALGSGV